MKTGEPCTVPLLRGKQQFHPYNTSTANQRDVWMKSKWKRVEEKKKKTTHHPSGTRAAGNLKPAAMASGAGSHHPAAPHGLGGRRRSVHSIHYFWHSAQLRVATVRLTSLFLNRIGKNPSEDGCWCASFQVSMEPFPDVELHIFTNCSKMFVFLFVAALMLCKISTSDKSAQYLS